MKLRLLMIAFITLAIVDSTSAQTQYPPNTKNAALRYWIAFAEMQDLSADKATQDLLEKTLSGEASWDGNKLVPILDANNAAIEIMQRATKLPECEWGLEYGQGIRASIAYAPRARALSRLNTLVGMRQLAAGDTQSALNSWLVGVRFSQDLARGGSLIFTLIAKGALLPNLRALTQATSTGKLTPAQQEQVSAAIRALPDDGFDWSAAWAVESATLEQFLHELQIASDPRALYQEAMGSPAPEKGLPPSSQDVHNYVAYMRSVQSALGQRPDKAKISLGGLESKRTALSDVEQKLIPNPQKSNLARIDIVRARTELLQALSRGNAHTAITN